MTTTTKQPGAPRPQALVGQTDPGGRARCGLGGLPPVQPATTTAAATQWRGHGGRHHPGRQAAGVLQPRPKVDVGAQVSGQVKKIHVQLGQQVKQGDLLVSLTPSWPAATMAQAEATLAQQRALIDSCVDLATLRKSFRACQRLMAGDATTGVDLERAEAEVAKLEVSRTARRRRHRPAPEAELAKASCACLTPPSPAPMDGTVVNLPVQEGQTVIAVQITPVMVTLANMDGSPSAPACPRPTSHPSRSARARFITLRARRSAEGRCASSSPCPSGPATRVFYNVLFEGGQQGPQAAVRHDRAGQHRDRQASKALTIPMVALGERGEDGRFDVTVLDKPNEQKRRQIPTGLQDGAACGGAGWPEGRREGAAAPAALGRRLPPRLRSSRLRGEQEGCLRSMSSPRAGAAATSSATSRSCALRMASA